MYESIYQKIAVTTYSFVKNHGFIDGNKRIGVSTMLLLLRLNGITVGYTQQELIDLGLKTAEGSWYEEDIEKWIREHEIRSL